ncbi:hypothetical protein D3C80_1392270 [compost metagenome]|uniref:hypothetical protein n=1 Tax=Pseudomonas TaxID=286 RepID=UPI000F91A1F9|nr:MULTISPECIES: hypothetical protein [Pseudomonas]MDH1932356.1 hypothetical protein [Pseudomonas sp. GD03696]HDS0961602.1 hypothetical protein [Pseudomonas putida]
MSFKDEGKCPFCSEVMTPEVVEENNIRRDKCKCVKCNRNIYVCRAPGCRDYARGGEVYDDEFCMSCSDKLSEFGKNATEQFGTAAVIAGTTLATAWLTSLNKK